MRSPRLSNPWPAVKAAPLPAATAIVAGVMLLGQIVLPIGEPDLPTAAIPSAANLRPMPAIAAVPAYPAIVAAPVFTPDRSGAAGSGEAASGDLILLGTVTTRRSAVAVLQTDAGPQSVPIGRTFGPWRLVGVGRDHATFVSAAGSRTVRIGEAPRPAAARPEEAEQPQ